MDGCVENERFNLVGSRLYTTRWLKHFFVKGSHSRASRSLYPKHTFFFSSLWPTKQLVRGEREKRHTHVPAHPHTYSTGTDSTDGTGVEAGNGLVGGRVVRLPCVLHQQQHGVGWERWSGRLTSTDVAHS